MKAVGRVAMTLFDAPDNEYLLKGMLWCRLCRCWMVPSHRADGKRTYSCGPRCRQRDVLAWPAETHLSIGAVTRAVTTLCPDLARVHYESAGPVTGWRSGEQPEFDADEERRWKACDLSDRRAMLRVAYVRVEVDEDGQLHPVRHAVGATP